jgi:hypothetical protein
MNITEEFCINERNPVISERFRLLPDMPDFVDEAVPLWYNPRIVCTHTKIQFMIFFQKELT